MKKLTKPEEQIMNHLWKLEKAFLKDIVNEFSNPKPAYTTIATVVGVLVKKKFIGFKTEAKGRRYYPRIKKNKYLEFQLQEMVSSFFNGSSAKLASFFTENQDLSIKEMEEIQQLLKTKIDELRKNDQ